MNATSKAILTSALLASAAPTTAWAVDGEAKSAASESDIVVTARRREEVLSKVPLTVTALNADALADHAIRNENDLQSAVPGLVIKQAGSANRFIYVIRGQTIDNFTNSPPGVLPYINEAQVVTLSASTLYDMAGIQVLKGPQGTLFGRNTTGGAVLFQTAQPDDDFGGYVDGRYGRWDNYQIQGAFNLPIDDAVILRIAASKTGGGGYVQRLDNGKRYGNLEQESIRGTLVLKPLPGLKNTLVVQHTTDGGTNAPTLLYHSQAYACGNGVNNDSADCGYQGYPYGLLPGAGALPYMTNGVVALAAQQDALGPYTAIGQNSSLRHSAKSTFAINTTEIELGTDHLLKNIFMLNNSSSDDKIDYDGSPFPILEVTGNLTPDLTAMTNEGPFYNRAKQLSNELQLQGKILKDKVDYTLGLYYINQNSRFDSAAKFFDFYPLHVYGPTAPTYFPVHYAQDTNNESWAVFGQATYALTEAFHVTAGLRYTWDKSTARQLPSSDFYGCVPSVCFGSAPPSVQAKGPDYFESLKASKPSWNVSLDYQASPDLLLYVTHRGSWRTGGFNYSLPPLPLDSSQGGNKFKPETTYDIEAGLKYNGRALGFPTTFNVAVYNQWVKNIQRGAAVTSPVTQTVIQVTASVPEAQITGVEADVYLKPVQGFGLGGSVVYTNARFTKNAVTIPGNPPLFYGPYADSPKWSGTVFAELSHDFGAEAGIVGLRTDFYFQSKSYFANLGDQMPGSDISAYQLVGVRLSWDEVMGSNFSIAAYGRNIFNEKYYTGGNPTGLSAGFMSAFPGFPRSYGIEGRVKF
jgi:iron complex outermembrane recepter protein